MLAASFSVGDEPVIQATGKTISIPPGINTRKISSRVCFSMMNGVGNVATTWLKDASA